LQASGLHLAEPPSPRAFGRGGPRLASPGQHRSQAPRSPAPCPSMSR
jgi:hypothetical protein